MSEINVACHPDGDGFACEVTVVDPDGSRSHHSVALSRSDLDRYARPGGEPYVLLECTFRFLLEREPKESILTEFRLPDVERYFPEYGREIRGQLAR